MDQGGSIHQPREWPEASPPHRELKMYERQYRHRGVVYGRELSAGWECDGTKFRLSLQTENETIDTDMVVMAGFFQVLADQFSLFCAKHHDYGRGNIQKNGE